MYTDTFFKTKKLDIPIEIKQLSPKAEDDVYRLQAATWADQTWGYLDKVKNNSINEIRKRGDQFYVTLYDGIMIGMFSLSPNNSINDSCVVHNLMYVYIHPNFRNLGIGRTMIKLAKSISECQGANTMTLETLNPQLNKFYEKIGATFVYENHLHKTALKVVETSFLKI